MAVADAVLRRYVLYRVYYDMIAWKQVEHAYIKQNHLAQWLALV